MPRICYSSLPPPASDIAQPFRERIEHDRFGFAEIAELTPSNHLHGAVLAAVKNPIRLENGNAELALEPLEQSEHAINRAAGGFRLPVDGDDEKAAEENLARGCDRCAVGHPRIEKRIDRIQNGRAPLRIERRRDAENPDSRIIGELRNVEPGHVDYTPNVSFAKLIQRFKGGEQQPQQQDSLRLATAAMLLEIAYADGEFTPAEDGDVAGYLQRAFGLDHESAEELIGAANELRTRTIDHFALTNFIRSHSSLSDRIEMVKTMWRMVYEDQKLTDYETYLVRKLADLLGLEHHVMIDAKVAVLRELGLST